MDWLVQRSSPETFQTIAYQDDARMSRYPMVDRTLADKGIQALGEDGKLWRKAAATGFCLKQVPGWRWLGHFLLSPLVRPFAEVGYALVAANRQTLSRWIGRKACRLRGPEQK